MSVRVSHERARGCGFRKQGGTYMVAPRPSEPCSLLPVEMSVCPCCGAGIKPARGWTWIEPDPILDAHYAKVVGCGEGLAVPRLHDGPEHSAVCPFTHKLGRVGLIWVGETFYKTPAEFMREAHDMGLSRRISQVPRDFKPGETWVLLGHRKAVPDGYKLKGEKEHFDTLAALREKHGDVDPKQVEDAFLPGVITAFRPTLEYVCRDEDLGDEEFLESLRKRGIEPVKVVEVHDEEALPV
jgi:hypothetical protein